MQLVIYSDSVSSIYTHKGIIHAKCIFVKAAVFVQIVGQRLPMEYAVLSTS